jgi:hypothetical protein
MPPDSIGLPGTLFLYRDHVRIVAGSFEATHVRLFQPGASSTLPEHRAQTVAAVSGKRGRRYLKRQHLLEIGESAFRYLTEILHRHPRTWVSEVDRLHDLLQSHGQQPLRAAFDRALAAETFGVAYIEHYLRDEQALLALASGTAP